MVREGQFERPDYNYYSISYVQGKLMLTCRETGKDVISQAE